MARRRSCQGLTLIETVVALAVLALVLLLGVTAVSLYRYSVARLEAHREALHVLEATVESVRVGAVPLVSGEPVWTVPPPAPVAQGRIKLRLDVTPIDDPPDLYDLVVIAEFSAAGKPARRQLRTIVWQRPGSPSSRP